MIKKCLFLVNYVNIFSAEVSLKINIVNISDFKITTIQKNVNFKKGQIIKYNDFFKKIFGDLKKIEEYVILVNSKILKEDDKIVIDDTITVEIRQKYIYNPNYNLCVLKKNCVQQVNILRQNFSNKYIMTCSEITYFINSLTGIDDIKDKISYIVNEKGYCCGVEIIWSDDDFEKYFISFTINNSHFGVSSENCLKFKDFDLNGNYPQNLVSKTYACYSYLTPFHLRFIGAKIYKTYCVGNNEISREEIKIQNDEDYEKFLNLTLESNYERRGKYCNYVIEFDEIKKVFNCGISKEGFNTTKAFSVYLPDKFSESDCQRFLLGFFKISSNDVFFDNKTGDDITMVLKKNSDFSTENFAKSVKEDHLFKNFSDFGSEDVGNFENEKKNTKCCCF